MVNRKKKLIKKIKSLTSLRQKKNKAKLQHYRTKESIPNLDSFSSSSSTTESTDSYLANREVLEEEEYNFFDTLFDSVSDSDVETEEPEYLQQKTLQIVPDFFDNLGEMPNIEIVSRDVSIAETEKPEQIRKPVVRGGDTGKFVNPITGREESSDPEAEVITEKSKLITGKIEKEPLKKEEEEEKEEEEDHEETLATYKTDETCLFVVRDDILEDTIEDETKCATAEDPLDMFLVFQELEKAEVEDIDWEAIEREQEAKQIYAHTIEFITDLINKAVEVVEDLSPEKLLIQRLDKRKLITALLNILPEYTIEKKCSDFLNRQVANYHKRKQSLRSLIPDNPKTALEDKQMLLKANERLDKLLLKEKKTLKTLSGLQNELKSQYEQDKERALNLVKEFEHLVRKHFHHDSTPKLNTVVDQLLAKMRKYRKEISQVRFFMIIQQHTQATLMKFMSQLEDLGNNLHIREFNNLQAETQTLGKKIEERNSDLHKLYIRCQNDIHSLAHYKEKQQMLSNSIDLQELILGTLLNTKQGLRERLYSLKVQRVNLHGQIQKLSAQGGLIDKPDLMYDYDATVQRYEEDLATVNYLKQKMKDIEMKLNNIYKTCPNIKQ